MNDDVGMVEKIYARAGLRMTGEARAVLRQFVDAHKGDYGGVICDLKGQFGVDPNELRRLTLKHSLIPESLSQCSVLLQCPGEVIGVGAVDHIVGGVAVSEENTLICLR